MYAHVVSLGVTGLDGYPVTVETHISGGLPKFAMVGLPDSAVKESSERVRSAIKNLNCPWPASHVTVNLAPADVRKTGSLYDLPVFIGILAAQQYIPQPEPHQAFLGELGLDGTLRPIAGALPMALAAQKAGVTELFVPAENAAEAAVAEQLTVYPARSAADVIRHLAGQAKLSPASRTGYDAAGQWLGPDFADVRGQAEARRALEVAAAGGHNLLMVGPPGTGKSMLAKRLPGILPPLSYEEALETTAIYSVAGLVQAGTGLLQQRPFRSPHHSVSAAAIASQETNIIPTECGCQRQIELFAQMGCWQEDDNYLPLPGDIIYYSWGKQPLFSDCTGWSNHVGIVVGTAGPFIKVIEGNKNDRVAYRYILRGYYQIRGYGLPDYGST